MVFCRCVSFSTCSETFMRKHDGHDSACFSSDHRGSLDVVEIEAVL